MKHLTTLHMQALGLKLVLVFLCFITSGGIQAQKNGYYVTLKNDTIPAFIHLRTDVFGPYSYQGVQKEVRISMNAGDPEKVYKPGELSSFYVKSDKGEFHFHSKPLDEGKLRFMKAEYRTSLASLYSYLNFSGSRTIGMNESTYYTIQKGDSTYLFVGRKNHVKLKKVLLEFFAGQDAVLEIIESLFKQPGFVDRDLLQMFRRIEEIGNSK